MAMIPSNILVLLLMIVFTASSALAEDAPTTTPASSQPTTLHPALFLVGDSIMSAGKGDGLVGPRGYGWELVPMFDPAKIHVYNEGKGGRSSRGYIEEGAWAGVLSRMQSGDWVLVQFGNNDAANSKNYPDRISGKGSGDDLSEVDAPGGKKLVHSYGWYLKQYANDAKTKGATAIIISPSPRNKWADGKIKRGMDGYVEWAAQAASDSGELFIDLNTLAADRYDAIGQEAAAKLFNDSQHSTKAGAKTLAECVAEGLRRLSGCALVEDLFPKSNP